MPNPFIAGSPTAAPAVESSLAGGLLTTPFLQDILQYQRHLHQAMTEALAQVQQQHSTAALLFALLFSFGYGVFHVLAPGHGKVIVTAYFLGNKARWREGVWAGLIMAIGHTITAVAIVGVLYLVLGLSQFSVIAHASYVELAGYGLIAGIGVWLFYKTLRQHPPACGCSHTQHHVQAPKSGIRLFAATSLVPCTGSMTLLLFTLANHMLWLGVLCVVAIALGMWLTITGLGVASMLLHHAVLGNPAFAKPGLRKLAGLVAASIVIITGTTLFLGALADVLQP